eukprot:TRINITY_DN8369_c0_g1_i1.p1 TRINITY_DN8369_c0_g1~~TRINITY_DN8369_c0_g1_i1.p1  ORF type:complete len:195 (-),score=32.83 TRINITY_DN8369_c0_g1_i1:161-745(-)
MSTSESTDSHHNHHHDHHHHHHHKDASPAAGAPPHRFIGEDELLTSLDKKDIVKVVEETLDLNLIANEVASTAAGAIATFSGTTRDHHNGKRVLKLEYEAYVPMAEKEMIKICQEMRKKWPIIHVAMYHRYGLVPITETSVIVAVSSIHRRDALEACEYGIDEIKAKVPIWKKEFYEDGSTWKENAEWRASHKC